MRNASLHRHHDLLPWGDPYIQQLFREAEIEHGILSCHAETPALLVDARGSLEPARPAADCAPYEYPHQLGT